MKLIHRRKHKHKINIYYKFFFIAQRGRVFINGEPIIYSLYQQRSSIPTTAFGCYSGIMLSSDDRIIVWNWGDNTFVNLSLDYTSKARVN